MQIKENKKTKNKSNHCKYGNRAKVKIVKHMTLMQINKGSSNIRKHMEMIKKTHKR